MKTHAYCLTAFLLFVFFFPVLLQAQAGDDRFEFLAKTVKANNKIDDEFNAQAPEGWEPLFVLEDEERMRLIFARSQNVGNRNTSITYRAETVGKKREIDDKMNELAADNWTPLFVIEDLIRYRIIFGKDAQADATPMEYRAELIDESRYLDDKFNELGATGWQPMFGLNDAERFRIIFGRPTAGEQETKRYRALKVLYPREIDDKFNELGAEWKPILGFPDGIEYRLIFVENQSQTGTTYMADKVAYSRHIEDKFVQHNAAGWFPRFVFLFEEDASLLTDQARYRLIFSR